MDMLEFVARSLCVAAGVHPDAPATAAGFNWWSNGKVQVVPPGHTRPAWVAYVNDAQTAIDAIDRFRAHSVDSRMQLATLIVEQSPVTLIGMPRSVDTATDE